jgi:hypothetical protein
MTMPVGVLISARWTLPSGAVWVQLCTKKRFGCAKVYVSAHDIKVYDGRRLMARMTHNADGNPTSLGTDEGHDVQACKREAGDVPLSASRLSKKP